MSTLWKKVDLMPPLIIICPCLNFWEFTIIRGSFWAHFRIFNNKKIIFWHGITKYLGVKTIKKWFEPPCTFLDLKLIFGLLLFFLDTLYIYVMVPWKPYISLPKNNFFVLHQKYLLAYCEVQGPCED